MKMFGYLLAGLFATQTMAAVWEGTISDPDGFAFMGKFVFDNNPDDKVKDGSIAVGLIEAEFNVSNPKADNSDLVLLLFDDEPKSWPDIYVNRKKKTKTCREALQLSQTPCNVTGGGVVPRKCFNYVTVNGDGSVTLPPVPPIEQRLRQRHWFVVAANCTADGVVDLSYKLTLINRQQASWNEQFGSDERGLNTFFLCFAFLYVGMVLVDLYSAFNLSKKLNYLHPIVKTFLFIVLLQMLMVILNAAHYGTFSKNGQGLPAMKTVGEFIDIVARCLFVMLLMLLAKGWTIKNEELTGKALIIGIPAAFMVLDFIVLLVRDAIADPAQTHVNGFVQFLLYALMFVWTIFAGWFGFTIFKSIQSEENPVKRKLFQHLAVVYIPWFIGLPLTTFLTIFISDWARDRVITMISLAISTAAYLAMTGFLWHSWAEENFNVNAPDVMQGSVDTYEQL